MKFKTKEELDCYINEKRAKQYETVLTEPLSLDEIDILRKKPDNVTLRQYYDIQTKSEKRITSVLELLYEIEGFDFGGWSYGSDDSETELQFWTETRFYVFTYDSDTFISNVFQNELPVGYLFLEKKGLINFYLGSIQYHYSAIIEECEKASKKREVANTKQIETLLSIKSKVTAEEFKFVVNKCRLTKKEKKSLLG